MLTERAVDRTGDAYGSTFADFVAKESKTSVVGRVYSAVKFSSQISRLINAASPSYFPTHNHI